MKNILLFVLLVFCSWSFAQSKSIDSLKIVLTNAKADSVKYNASKQLASLNSKAGNYPEFIFYIRQATSLAQKNKNDAWLVTCNTDYAQFLINSNKYDSALVLLKEAEDICNEKKLTRQLGVIFYARSLYFKNTGDFNKAIENTIKSVNISEKLKDSVVLGVGYNMLGNLFHTQKTYDKALLYYKKAYVTDSIFKDEFNLSIALSNIGLTYSDLKQDEIALIYYKKALVLKEKIGNKKSISNTYNLIGTSYQTLKKYDLALTYYNKALEIKQKINDAKGISISLLNIGTLLAEQKKYPQAIDNYLQAISYAQKVENKDILKEIYKGLGDSYSKINKGREAYAYLLKYSDLKDTLYNEENSRQFNEMQTKYETEKKETENKLLQTENALSGKTIKQQKIINYFIVGGLILALLFAFFIFRGLKAQRRANKIISKQKEEVHHQKEIVEEKQKEILDSIHYAKRIQRAVITSDNYISQYVKDYFVYYQPKDIVSGDFYWALHTNNKFYLATADCTGHGVPGAFMSLLNISILNEVMIEKEIARADLILNETRKDIIKSLNPTGSEESKDGMDCILACFDFENLKLEYAAANNSFYIVRDNQLITCLADKMPVGKSPRDTEPFILHAVDLQKGDTVYMLTDGLPDQFGGPKGKKYKYKQLEDLLIANNEKSLAEQKEILNASFQNWKGNLEQVDDVLLIGIKI